MSSSPSPSATAPEAAFVPASPGATPPADAGKWFKEEVHPHGAQLKSWLRGQFPDVRDVDDVVQESYLRIWKARAAHPIDSAKAFLFSVARHLALDTIRKAKNSPLETSSDLASLRVLDSAPTAVQAALTQETIELLVEALAALPARYRNVIVLHKLKGFSARETGEQLGLSENSVYQYCCRALELCEDYLKKKGIDRFFDSR